MLCLAFTLFPRRSSTSVREANEWKERKRYIHTLQQLIVALWNSIFVRTHHWSVCQIILGLGRERNKFTKKKNSDVAFGVLFHIELGLSHSRKVQSFVNCVKCHDKNKKQKTRKRRQKNHGQTDVRITKLHTHSNNQNIPNARNVKLHVILSASHPLLTTELSERVAAAAAPAKWEWKKYCHEMTGFRISMKVERTQKYYFAIAASSTPIYISISNLPLD